MSKTIATFDLPQHGAAGVRCAGCAERVCDALRDVPGVGRVECDAVGTSVRVEYDPERLGEADLSIEMDRFGLELAENVRHAAWRVTGLD